MDQAVSPARVVLLIPALNPDGRLLELVASMKDCWTGPVLLVDDGSDQDHRSVFDRAEAMGCTVIRHARNLGKGRALKTGFNHCLNTWPDAVGCVTADADGQHTPEDILACAHRLQDEPGALVLGCRDFASAGVPLRSQLGNIFTRNSMRFLCGVRTTDTQTGLRGISSPFMSHMLSVPGERFEYETNMLLETRSQEVPIREVSIQTVYLEGNKSSHFNPLVDSVRIYALILKFCAASLGSFLVDILFFSLFYYRLLPGLVPEGYLIIVCTVLARLISATVNYLINRKAVFHSKKKAAGSGARYFLLSASQMLVSAGLVTLCRIWLPGPLALWKVLVDFLLFFLSFQLQRRWVF